jgi:hypothetical protein
MLETILLLIGMFVLILIERTHTQRNHILTLLRQTSRWAIASEQDESPLIAVLHANYAVGYLSALKEIATDMDIEQTTGIDILNFQKRIYTIQDQATRKATKECPTFVPQNPLTIIAGNR